MYQTVHVWALSGVASLVVFAINRRLGWKTIRHSDGGGSDGGSSYSYVPNLRPEFSYSGDKSDEMWPNLNDRQRVLCYLIICAGGPVSLFWNVFSLLVMHLLPRFFYWLSRGKVSNLVPEESYTERRE